jgi:hypothetical protein
MSWLDLPLWLVGLATEITVAAILVRQRMYRLLPVFSLYLLWSIISDLIGVAISTKHPSLFMNWYLFEMPLDCALQFVVLVELAWSALRPARSLLPRWTPILIAFLIFVLGAAVWPLAGFTQLHGISQLTHMLLRIRNTVSILRILFFVALAAGSQLLSLSWRDRELQVATGLGFYSLVSLAGAMVQAQMTVAMQYHYIDQIEAVCYLLSLVYWTVSFAQKEAPRHEFSPQMESFLLKVSGAARANRMALEKTSLPGDPRR